MDVDKHYVYYICKSCLIFLNTFKECSTRTTQLNEPHLQKGQMHVICSFCPLLLKAEKGLCWLKMVCD